MRIFYSLFIGLPLSIVLMCAGVLLCCTIIGIPFGLALIAAAHNVQKLR